MIWLPSTNTTLRAMIGSELCPAGQSASAMLDEVFLWCRDRRIYGPSPKELERLVRSQRQQYQDELIDRLQYDERNAGQASVDNILRMTARLAFIQKLALPHPVEGDMGAWAPATSTPMAGSTSISTAGSISG